MTNGEKLASETVLWKGILGLEPFTFSFASWQPGSEELLYFSVLFTVLLIIGSGYLPGMQTYLIASQNKYLVFLT